MPISSALGGAPSSLVEQVQRSVVLVHSSRGHGSGVVWKHAGEGALIVTNDHVVSNSRSRIEAGDGREFEARFVARDPANDLALLLAPNADLPAAPPGDSRELRVGDLVVAIGHPWGVRFNATLGIVSGRGSTWLDEAQPVRHGGRAKYLRRELLQADIALAPGNSGGPLADASGAVVGIACMVAAPGIALAIPAHVAENLVRAFESKKGLVI